MKAILVVNIPDYINTVTKGFLKPIGTVGRLEIDYGSDDGVTRYQFIDTDGMLLKPMPQKKDDLRYLDSYAKGYNDCIDEILGEQE